MSADGQRFCLKWNDFRNSVTAVFEDLRQDEELVDITLCCEGKKVKAHRMMLSACSPYFRELLKENPCQHPVFFLKDTTFADLRAVVEFVYNGEVNVTQGQLSSFLKTAEMLQVRGLTGDDEKDGTATPAPAAAPSPRVLPPMPAAPPRAFPRRPSVGPPQQPMRLPPTPVKRPLPATPPMQTPQKRIVPPPASPMSQPPANNFVPEVVTMPDSPPPPPPPPASTTPAPSEPRPDSSPASKRRRHSGSSGGEGPVTPAGADAAASPSPAASPAGTSSDAPLPSPAPPSVPASQQPLTPQQPELGAPQGAGEPPAPEYGGQPGGLVKVEKVDIADDDDGLAALGQVVNYEGGSYDSDQSLGAMPMSDPSQAGGMYVPGPSDGGAGSVDGLPAANRWSEAARAFACHLCPRRYCSQKALNHHQGLHEGRTFCDRCGKRFSTVSARNSHWKKCSARSRGFGLSVPH